MEKGYFQAQAEMARFDEGGARHHRSAERIDNQMPSPVVPHMTEKYDPDHPDADWGGYVRRSYTKRFYTNQSSIKDNLAYENGVILPREVVASTTGKKLFDPQQVASSEQVPGIPFQSSVYQVGPGNNVSCSDWKTSYTSQSTMETTPADTFVLGTRQNSQHKRHVAPMYEQAHGSRQNSARSRSPFDGGQTSSHSSGLSGSGSSGSLSGRRFDSRRSLLAGIGKLVAAEDLSGLQPPPDRNIAHSYADPSSKTLLVENYHGSTVGYTGRRNM